MPNPNITFGGQTIFIPGAYYQDNVNVFYNAPPPTTPPLIFVGYSYGQKPFTPVTFTTPQALTQAMRGGPGSVFVPFLTNPSPSLEGAQLVTLINVGANTQATYSLQSSGGSNVITMTTADYGPPSNLMQVMVTGGSLGGKFIEVYDGYSGNEAQQDNLGVPFQISYLGTATGVSYSVVSGASGATTFLTTGGHTGENLTITLGGAGYSTVGLVCEYLDGTGVYSANVISQGDLPSTYLDTATNVALATGVSGGAYVQVTAALGDIVWFCNQHSNQMITAVSSGTSSPSTAPVSIPLTHFTGATSTPPTNSSYASGFNAGLNVPGWVVFADSNTQAVQLLGAAHVEQCSTPAGASWRRFFTGSSLGDSISTTITNAQALDSIEVCYLYPGVTFINTTTSQVSSGGGLYAAAMAAGIACANQIAQPLTNQALQAIGVEYQLNGSQIYQLQNSGVLPVWKSPTTNVPSFISDLTTWQQDSNPENLFSQQVACRWWLAYLLTAAMQPYVGSIAAPQSEARIRNAVIKTLNGAIYADGGNGVITAWNANSLQLTYTGATQTTAIQVDVMLVGQNRFITIETFILPFSLTAAQAALLTA